MLTLKSRSIRLVTFYANSSVSAALENIFGRRSSFCTLSERSGYLQITPKLKHQLVSLCLDKSRFYFLV